MMLDTEQASSKRRFGLFSQPPSTAIGDDSPFKQKHGIILIIQPGRARTVSLSPCRETCCQERIVQVLREGASSMSLRAFTRAINTQTQKKSIQLTTQNCTQNHHSMNFSSNPHLAKKHSTCLNDKDPNTPSRMSTKTHSQKSSQRRTIQAESSLRTKTSQQTL